MTEPLLGPDRIQSPLLTVSAVSEVVGRSERPWFVDVESGTMLGLRRVRKILLEESSPYQLLQYVDLEELGRTLVLDGRIQLAESDEHIYHEMFVHPPMMWGRSSSVLVLGGGDGCLLRELVKWPFIERILMVELDEAVVRCFRDRFPELNDGAFEDPRVEVRCEDAMKVLQLEEKFDLVLADLTEPYDDSGVAGEISSSLFDRDFWSGLREQLNEMGIFAAQTGGLRLGRSTLDPHHADFVRTLEEVFGHVRVAYEFVPSFEAFWTITFAAPDGFRGCPTRSDPELVDTIDEVLNREGVETRYYDGLTHFRLFAPPVDQGTLYGW